MPQVCYLLIAHGYVPNNLEQGSLKCFVFSKSKPYSLLSILTEVNETQQEFLHKLGKYAWTQLREQL